MVSKEDVRRIYSEGGLSDLVFHRYDSDEDEKEIAECILDLHNNEEIDLLSIATSPSFLKLSGVEFFVGQHLLCKIIPRVAASSKSMMTFVSALVAKAGDDLAANRPNRAFVDWLKLNPGKAWEIIEGSKANDPLSIGHLTFALTSTAAADEALMFLDAYCDVRRLSAMAALSRMVLSNEKRLLALSAFGTVAATNPDDATRQNLLEAALKIALDDPVTPKEDLHAILGLLCVGAGPMTTYQACQALWSYGKKLDSEAFLALSQCIETISPEMLGTVHQLDIGVRALLDTPLSVDVLGLLKRLISRGQVDIANMDSVSHDLPIVHPDIFRELVVDWLLDGRMSLCLALGAFFQEDMKFDVGRAADKLTDVQRYFVARKAIGYFFAKPILASSFLVSMLRVASGETRSLLGDLLIDPLLRNYGGDARDYVASIQKEDPAADQVTRALSVVDEYLERLRSVGIIEELRPPESNLQAARNKWHDEIRRAMKDAEKRSVMLSLVSRSTLLYGRRSLAKVRSADAEGSWSEFSLHEHSATFELPRMEIIDPNGLDHLLRTYRVEQLRK